MRIADEVGSMAGEFRTQIGAIPAGEPKRVAGHGRIRAPDHFELQIRGYIFQRHWRMGAKVGRSQATFFLAAEQCKNDGPARPWTGGEHPCEFEDGSCARSIVIGSVVNVVAVDRRAYTKMVEMGGQQNGFVLLDRIAARNLSHHVPGVGFLGACGWRAKIYDNAVGYVRELSCSGVTDCYESCLLAHATFRVSVHHDWKLRKLRGGRRPPRPEPGRLRNYDRCRSLRRQLIRELACVYLTHRIGKHYCSGSDWRTCAARRIDFLQRPGDVLGSELQNQDFLAVSPDSSTRSTDFEGQPRGSRDFASEQSSCLDKSAAVPSGFDAVLPHF